MAETWELSPRWHGNSYNFTGLSFLSNGETFSSIKVNGGFGNDTIYYDDKYIVNCQDDDYIDWIADVAYATITFSTPPTGGLLTWLQANGTKQSNKLSVDLTTLSGWSNLAPGNHTIKIVAKGTGYRDSEKSAGVEVTKPAEAYTDCLTFTGETSEFTLKASSKEWDGTLQWSTDHNTWTNLTATEEMQSVGKKLYLRGKGNTNFFRKNYYGVRWVLSEKAGCSGNIQTLLDWENPPTSISVVTCYANMFHGCTNLTTAPELPATTLAQRCYAAMFYDCTKLKINTSSGNKIFTCPSTIPNNAVQSMFGSTGGTFTGTPTAGNTYYWTE